MAAAESATESQSSPSTLRPAADSMAADSIQIMALEDGMAS